FEVVGLLLVAVFRVGAEDVIPAGMQGTRYSVRAIRWQGGANRGYLARQHAKRECELRSPEAMGIQLAPECGAADPELVRIGSFPALVPRERCQYPLSFGIGQGLRRCPRRSLAAQVGSEVG